MKRAVVVLSGGMDSALAAAIAKEQGYEIFTLHLNYGQLTQKRELKAFYDISHHFNAAGRQVIDTGFFTQLGGSSLIGDGKIDMFEALPDDIGERGKNDIPRTYVPFRNGFIISLAAAWGELIDAQTIFIGVVEEDSSGYPDCRKEFYKYLSPALAAGTANGITVSTPLLEMSKKQIVQQGELLKLPFELTWSCYTREDIPCGTCESCLLRARGFNEAGIKDPLLENK